VTILATAPSPGFESPGVGDFQLPPIFGEVTKPVVQLVLAAVIVYAFFTITARRPQLVPSKVQFLGESFHGIVRNSIARDNIGPEFLKFVPYLTTLFAFILVNNLFGIIPLIQFPTFAHPGMPYALAIMSWLIYNAVGIRRHGFVGYMRVSTWPPGVPWWVRIILTPIEFLSNILLRPVTLSLRSRSCSACCRRSRSAWASSSRSSRPSSRWCRPTFSRSSRRRTSAPSSPTTTSSSRPQN
jgi:F-type H+-transporting ATPase subunit a